MSKSEYLTDVECYWNYFLVALEDLKTGEQFEYSIRGKNTSFSKEQRRSLRKAMTRNRHYTFNGRNYDLLVMTAATLGYTCEELKLLTNAIIEEKMRPWDIEKEYDFKVPEMDHVDLIEVAFGKASLKIYNGRVHGRRLQDLPYDPDRVLSEKQCDNVCDYCFNDLDATRNVLNAVRGQLDLRVALTKIHGIDLRSKSDAQVAEAIIRKEMTRLTGKCEKPDANLWRQGKQFYYKAPSFIKFKSKKLRDLLDLICNTPFEIGKGGYVNLPLELKEKIRINEGVYTLGIGGLHSNEKTTTHIAGEDYILRDSDVTSYYPSIILALKLFPKQLGTTFLRIYQKIVDDRVFAKHKVQELEDAVKRLNDPDSIADMESKIKRYKIEADGGKIMVNGSFGKFGSKYSILYSPPLLIQTTITGQLSLLMLIEALEDIGIQVVSANTDGIISKIPVWMENEYKEVLDWWQEQTGFNMEFTDYSGVYSRDVNSYIAVSTKGKVKTKGAYSMGAMSNNPQTEIAIEAVINHITGKKSIISTIKECKDIRKFITLRTVNGGAIWPVVWDENRTVFHHEPRILEGEYLGKAIRWYYAKDIDWSIHYKKPTKSGTHNKVPKTDGARPIMEFEDTQKDDLIMDDKGKPSNPFAMPKDIDHSWYMRRAYDILAEIGLETDPCVIVKRTRKKEEEPDDFVAPDKYGIVSGMVA